MKFLQRYFPSGGFLFLPLIAQTATLVGAPAGEASFATASTTTSTSLQLVVTPNVNVSQRSGYEAEVALAVNPTNPKNVVVLSNTESNGLFAGVSNDGGATWATRIVATGSDGIAAACCDPSLAFDNFGNLFVGYLNAATTAVVVTISKDGGASFSPLAKFAGSVDQPTVTTGPGSVWVTYQSSNNIVARRASVQALGTVGAFSAEQIATNSSAGNFGDIVVGPNGKVAVTYQKSSLNNGPSTIYANVDATGLAAGGFGSRITVTSSNVGDFDTVPPQPGRSVDAEAGLAWDRTGGLHHNRLYMVYTDETVNESNDLNILVRHSDNDGVSWSAPVRVNDDTGTKTQMLPRIALDPTTGNIAVVWYDARNDSTDKKVEFWGSVSTDGGQTFLPNVKISSGASNGTKANIGDPNEFGDYTGLTFYGNVLYAGWADSSNSTGDNPNGTKNLDIYVGKVTLGNADALNLSTVDGLVSSGKVGGPFSPSVQSYTLTNKGSQAITWSAVKSQTWVTLSSTGGTLAAGASINVNVSINSNATSLSFGKYSDTVTFRNVTSGVAQTRSVSLNIVQVKPDYFTQIFSATGNSNDTDNQSWLFTPNGSSSFYSVLRTARTTFPSSPTGGTVLDLSDDSQALVTPTGGVKLSLYGTSYDNFHVGSNGYITFGAGDTDPTETLADHFSQPRISALFDDLNPRAGGAVSWRQFSNRVAVTFQGVPEYSKSNSNNFQIEMFFDGRIRITCLNIATTDGLIGLSRGNGLPADFVASDFSLYPSVLAAPTINVASMSRSYLPDVSPTGSGDTTGISASTAQSNTVAKTWLFNGLTEIGRYHYLSGMPGVGRVFEVIDGKKYLTLIVAKPHGSASLHPIVEVSPNLIDWFSGKSHTTVMQDDIGILKVRDNTPMISGTKRFIRLKPGYR